MIVVGTTIAPWKCDGRQEFAWLDTAEQLIDDTARAGHFLHFFAALEVDGRGLAPYEPLMERLSEVWEKAEAGTFWKFAMDDGHTQVESGNRLIRICIGRNMIHEYAMRYQATHLLLLDSDISPQGDCISRFLELERPVCGGNVEIYCMNGSRVVLHEDTFVPRWTAEAANTGPHNRVVYGKQRPWNGDVRAHWNTAGFLFLQRKVFSTVSWHYDLDAGLTDDPCFQRETRKQFGETWVRHDVKGKHVPIPMVPVEQRDGDRKRYPW